MNMNKIFWINDFNVIPTKIKINLKNFKKISQKLRKIINDLKNFEKKLN